MSKTYTTIQGDTWDGIAMQQLGSVAYTDKIMNLNAGYIDYYIFPAGILLTLPDISETKAASLPPWKQVSG